MIAYSPEVCAWGHIHPATRLGVGGFAPQDTMSGQTSTAGRSALMPGLRRMRARVGTRHAVVLLLLAAGALWCQQPSESPSFQLQMNVDRVLVPVVVRD